MNNTEDHQLTRRDKIKLWWLDNRREVVYYAGGCVAGVVATVIVYKNLEKGADVNLQPKQQNIFGTNEMTNVTEVIIQKPGNSGNVLVDPKTGEWFNSQGEAAKKLGKSYQAVRQDLASGNLLKVADGDKQKIGVS